MKTKISTLGSCSSRNIFNSNINTNYKTFFTVFESIEAVTFISLMSEKIEFDENLIDSNSSYDNYCALCDLSKNFLEFLKEERIDYLIIDTYFDAFYDVIVIGNNKYISGSSHVLNTSISTLFKDKPRINIYDNFKEYFYLFKESMDKFFDFMDKYCPNIKIILNCSRNVFKYEESGQIVENDNLKRMSNINPFRDILDSYILENFDVEILDFDENTLANKNHIFGIHPTHYEPKYYEEKIKQLNEIISRNDKFNYHFSLNVKFRALKRENQILKFNQKDNKLNKFSKELDKYLTSRIDIKNENNKNTLEIISMSDKNSLIDYPKWFDDEKGKGVTIHTRKEEIKFEIKCINDGNLRILFRARDMRDKKGNRIPIYINYDKIYINNEKINYESELVCHDNPYIYEKQVKDNEIVNITVCWSPF